MADNNNYKKHAKKKKKEREPFQVYICKKKTVYALNPTADIAYQKQKKNTYLVQALFFNNRYLKETNSSTTTRSPARQITDTWRGYSAAMPQKRQSTCCVSTFWQSRELKTA